MGGTGTQPSGGYYSRYPNVDNGFAQDDLYEFQTFYLRPEPFIDARTRIGSVGSCFADEISYFLQDNGFNYLLEEPGPEGWTREERRREGYAIHMCRYGNIFNTRAFRQLIDRAFGLWEPGDDYLYWNAQRRRYADPYRNGIFFQSKEEYIRDKPVFQKRLNAAFLKVDVLVITLGMIETWIAADDSAFSKSPPPDSCPGGVRPAVLTLEENVSNLARAVDTLISRNPGIRVILTVSPIPLNATLRPDACAVTATFHAKAVLRAAAERVLEMYPGRVHYFPAYETVMSCCRNPFQSDHRHVTPETVRRVMDNFIRTYGVSAAS